MVTPSSTTCSWWLHLLRRPWTFSTPACSFSLWKQSPLFGIEDWDAHQQLLVGPVSVMWAFAAPYWLWALRSGYPTRLSSFNYWLWVSEVSDVLLGSLVSTRCRDVCHVQFKVMLLCRDALSPPGSAVQWLIENLSSTLPCQILTRHKLTQQKILREHPGPALKIFTSPECTQQNRVYKLERYGESLLAVIN